VKYKGSCHCGKVAFEVEGELDGAMACNCSICSRKGSLLWFVPREQLRVLTSEEDIGTYTFNNVAMTSREHGFSFLSFILLPLSFYDFPCQIRAIRLECLKFYSGELS